MYIAAFSINLGDKVHLLKKVQIVYLKANEAPTKIPSKYANFINIFLQIFAIKFPKHTKIKDHAIKLVDD